jgi:phospholipid/cholesterol/gamma-HCH transport system permease protein
VPQCEGGCDARFVIAQTKEQAFMTSMGSAESLIATNQTTAATTTQTDGPPTLDAPPTLTVAHPWRPPNAVVSLGMRPSNSLATIGRAVKLFSEVLRYSVTDAISGRLPAGELITQAWSLYKVTALPAILMAVPFGAMVAVWIAGLINQLGATSLVGAASGVGIVRQGAPITAGLLMGGAAASAIASDLGARAIREELDAMRVLGVDPVRHLVVPRFLALIVLAPVLCAIIIASSVAASFSLTLLISDVAPGTFWLSFGAFAHMTDIWFAVAKSIVFAAITGIVSSLRGMEAKGGPRGVADAVNAAVVVNVVCIVIANVSITQIETMFFPMRVA